MGSGDGGGGVITWRERRENAIKKVEDNVRGSFLVELSRLHGERCHSMILERQVFLGTTDGFTMYLSFEKRIILHENYLFWFISLPVSNSSVKLWFH